MKYSDTRQSQCEVVEGNNAFIYLFCDIAPSISCLHRYGKYNPKTHNHKYSLES